MNMRRKFLSVLLAASLVLTLVPATALAEAAEGNFTVEAVAGTDLASVEEGTEKIELNISTEAQESLESLSVNVAITDTEVKAENQKLTKNSEDNTFSGTVGLEIISLTAGNYEIVVSDANAGGGLTQTTVDLTIVEKEVSEKSPSATLGDATISGKAGTALENSPKLTVTVADATLAEEATKTATNYTVNLNGVTVTEAGVADSVITLTLGGTPATASSDKIVVTINAAVIQDAEADLTTTENASAVWAIEAADVESEDPTEVPTASVAVTAPVTGAAPAGKDDITVLEADADKYGVDSIAWEPAVTDDKFAAEIAYSATIVLTVKDGYVFKSDIAKTDITVTNSASVTSADLSNDSKTLTVKAEFAETAKVKTPIETAAVTLTAPVTGETPADASVDEKADYQLDGTVTWNPAVSSTFAAGKSYKATVVLVPKDTDANEFTTDTKVTVAGSSSVAVKSVDAATGKMTVEITFPATTKKQVTATVTAPTASKEINYGQALSEASLTGGSVKDAENKDIAGTWAWKTPDAKPDAGDSQEFEAVFAVTDENIEVTNVAALTQKVSVNVKPVDVTIATVNTPSYVNTNTAVADLAAKVKATGVDSAAVNGTWAWYANDTEDTAITGGTATEVTNPFDGKTDNATVPLKCLFTPEGENYNKTIATITFTVTTKTIRTVAFTPDSATVTYGDAAPELTLKFTPDGSDEGATVAYASGTAATATVDPSTGAITIVGGGTTEITATVSANGDYTDCSAKFTLTVDPAQLAVTTKAEPATIKQGQTAQFSYEINEEGLKGEDTLADHVNNGSVTYELWQNDAKVADASAVSTLEPGTYEVRTAGLSAKTSSYELAYTYGTLTVTADGEVDPPGPTVAEPAFIPNGGSFSSFPVKVTITAADGAKILYSADGTSFDGMRDEDAADSPLEITLDGPATVKAIAVKDGVRSAVATATFSKKSTGGGSSSGGSGGGGGGGSSSVTVPVSGDDKSVEVSAKVSGSTATIDKIEGLNKVLDGDVDTGVVEIDLTALKKDIDTVKLPAAALEDIAKAAADGDNDVDGLAIKMDSGTVEFDADALEAIADQASGSTIELKLEKSNANGLNSSQKDAVKDMDIHGHFDLTLNGGKAITDFKGGRVSVKIPFTVPSGKEAANFVVIYVANDGSVEEMRTNCSGGYISFTTDHFSKYVIAYKAPEPVEPVEETPVAADCDGGSSCPAHKFTDVNTSLWYHKAVDYAINNSLMSGVGENTFSPNANLSRAMLAQILYNLAGRPAAAGASDFNDVAEGMWYTNAIAWAAENGVVSGLGNGKFGPNDNITREQLAVMLYRYAGSPAAGGSLDGFADAGKVSGYAQNGLVWATSNGVMSGKGGGMLDPQGLATRAEVAQMLYNYLNK